MEGINGPTVTGFAEAACGFTESQPHRGNIIIADDTWIIKPRGGGIYFAPAGLGGGWQIFSIIILSLRN